MARLRSATAALLLAGGFVLTLPAVAHADVQQRQSGSTDCILCWPGWG